MYEEWHGLSFYTEEQKEGWVNPAKLIEKNLKKPVLIKNEECANCGKQEVIRYYSQEEYENMIQERYKFIKVKKLEISLIEKKAPHKIRK